MLVFFTLLGKLIPLYIMIFLGYISSKKLHVQKESIASILLYIISPVVIFYGVYTVDMTWVNMSIPLLFFILCCVLSITFLYIGKLVMGDDGRKNILAYATGTGNVGYFGLPVVLATLGEEAFSLSVMAILGFTLYTNTAGFFITAKGIHTTRESVIKVIKLPMIYAFLCGLIFNYFNIAISESLDATIATFKGAYTLFGMMIIGMGLVGFSFKNIEYKFISLALFAKFLVWPLVIGGLILLDRLYFQLYTEVYSVLLIMSIVPLSANAVALATELKVYPKMTALAVLLSTFIALFYIPLFLMYFFTQL